MRAKSLLRLGLLVVVPAIAGCSGNSSDDPADDPPFPREVTSRDGSLTARLPRGWSRVSDSYPLALLTLASGPVSNRIIGPCQPGAIRDELLEGGALIRIAEIYPPDTPEIYPSADPNPSTDPIANISGLPARPGHIRLGRLTQTSECGNSYHPEFKIRHSRFYAWIWTKSIKRTEEVNGRTLEAIRPGRLAPDTRRQLVRLLNGLKVRPTAAAPIRLPFLSLRCRLPRNAQNCDRVWVQLTTRTEMKRLSIRVLRWSVKTPNGWVHSDPIASSPTRLRTPAGGAGRSTKLLCTTWTGVIPAGLDEGGAAFEGAFPGSRESWIGVTPRLRADLEIIGPDGRWRLRQVGVVGIKFIRGGNDVS